MTVYDVVTILRPFMRGSSLKTKNPETNSMVSGIPFSFLPKGNPISARVKFQILLGRSSDSRIKLPAAPSRPYGTVALAAFVPGHSGGSVLEFHQLPF
jgi:hypothetical protein